MGNILLSIKRRQPLVFNSDEGHEYWLDASAISMRLPSCWDELVDWTEDASRMFDVYLKHNSSTADSVTHASDEETERDINFRFQSLLLRSEDEKVFELSSMSLLDRAVFFAENVIIAVQTESNDMGVLTVGQFTSLYQLLASYTELVALVEARPPTRIEKIDCSICFDSQPNKVVLACSHQMCSRCHERWVHRRLKCPFCRYEFQKRSVRHSPWEMLDWQTQEVSKDVRKLELRLHNFMRTLEMAAISPDYVVAYYARERTIKIRESQESIIVN